MTEPTSAPPAKTRTWRPMAAWTGGILLALGLAWFIAAVVVPVWQVQKVLADYIQTDVWEPSEAVEALGGKETAIRKLHVYLRMPLGSFSRKADAIWLLECCGAMTVDELIALLRHREASVRESAALWLGQRRSRQAVVPLIEASRREPRPSVRGSMVRALGQIGDPTAMDRLMEALQDREEERGQAVVSVPVPFDAAEALGNMGSAARRVLPEIERLLGDEDEHVRSAAADALKKIRGEESKQ